MESGSAASPVVKERRKEGEEERLLKGKPGIT